VIQLLNIKLTIEVYADECDPSSICLTLKHEKSANNVLIYSSKNPNQKAIVFPLCESLLPTAIPITSGDPSFEELYDLL
jgi:hypothetical protein